MSWIKKLFRVFNSDEEYEEFEEEHPYIEPAKPKKDKDGREIESRILYQYPKGQFRFPLIPDEGSQAQERRPREKTETPKQSPRRGQRERSAEEPLHDERRKAGPMNDHKGRRNTRQPEQQEPYSEPVKSKVPADNHHRRPFRPTEIPSPIYGFERPKKKDEEVVYEMNTFSKEKKAPFFDDIDLLKKAAVGGGPDDGSGIQANMPEPEGKPGSEDLKGTISPDLRVGYEEASVAAGNADESARSISDSDAHTYDASHAEDEQVDTSEEQENQYSVTAGAVQERVWLSDEGSEPGGADSNELMTDNNTDLVDSNSDSIDSNPELRDNNADFTDSNRALMDSNAVSDTNLGLVASQSTEGNAENQLTDSEFAMTDSKSAVMDSKTALMDSKPKADGHYGHLIESSVPNPVKSEENSADIGYETAKIETTPLNLAALPESSVLPSEASSETENEIESEFLKEQSADDEIPASAQNEKPAELQKETVNAEPQTRETSLEEAAPALELDEEETIAAGDGRGQAASGDKPVQAEEEPKPKPRSPLPFNVIMLKQDRRIAEQKKREQNVSSHQVAKAGSHDEQQIPQENTVAAALPAASTEPETEANISAIDSNEEHTNTFGQINTEQPNEAATTPLWTAAEPVQQAEAEQSQVWKQQEQEVLSHQGGQPETPAAAEKPAEEKYQAYEFPAKSLLAPPVIPEDNEEWLMEQEEFLNLTLKNFNVRAKVVNVTQGPSVTRFEVQPEPGVKVNKITNLTDDIKLSLAARDIRMEAPIPGKHTIGIEVPNQKSRPVLISEIINTPVFRDGESPLTAVLGLDISGSPIVTDLRKMPHGLIAGATGSGKSVCINSILVSLLYKASPDELKLLLIDPKMVELAPYNQIPHLVSPVITDVKAATAALKWAVEEMERRYELFAHAGVRDINRFNELAEQHKRYSDKLPFIVIVIDELADLMMMSPADVEEAICRIAQKARACGIHLIIATQRPSVDVITGLIKANVPTRVAFSVSSQVDSRTIIDISGAEKLLGRGDMLFLENGSSKPVRLQGTYVSDAEIDEVVAHARSQRKPDYLFEQEELLKKAQATEEEDELFYEACEYVVDQGSASTSSVQRRFKIGYNRAARLIGMMEDCGYISEAKGSKPRDVLITEADLEAMQDTSTML